MSALKNKHILLGITGCIAAYKSAALIRLLQQTGAEVRVMMTKSAQEFITPLTLRTLSQHTVYTGMFEQDLATKIEHVSLARYADLILIAPATANIIAKLSCGLADDLVSTTCLASKAPLAVAPAMNKIMWQNKATQHNVEILKSRGVKILGPANGTQACGECGVGRMIEPSEIVAQLENFFTPKILQNKKILITAGSTQEALDPVRYISNHSSGKMGFALAQAAENAGATVTLIAGPVNTPPLFVETGLKPVSTEVVLNNNNFTNIIRVTTAAEMHTTVMQHISAQDIFISAAAVSDYRPQNPAKNKIKKTGKELNLRLEPNLDILAEVAKLPNRPALLVGFAAETENLEKNARQKLAAKNLDLIAANLVAENRGFQSDENEILLIAKDGKATYLPLAPKIEIASKIMSFIANLI